MKLYKLTDSNGMTRGETQWGPGVTHTATGDPSQGLCSNAYLHAYEHPLVALFLNPIHANFMEPQLWEADGDIGARDGQLKCGCRTLTTVRQLPLPAITTEQRMRFAIGCAWQVYGDSTWRKWAMAWLTNVDRSAAAARAAAWAARTEAWAAAWAAEVAAAARAVDISVVAEWAMTNSVEPPNAKKGEQL